MKLLYTDRGDVFWLEERKGQLTMAAKLGKSDTELGKSLDGPSIVGWVYEKKRHRIVNKSGRR